jgi:hypothetical protein
LQRVTELLKREVSELLRRELNVQEVGLLSVNEVKVAPDLKTATVFAFGSGKVNLIHIRDFGTAVFDQTHDLCVEPNRFFKIVYCDTKLTNC